MPGSPRCREPCLFLRSLPAARCWEGSKVEKTRSLLGDRENDNGKSHFPGLLVLLVFFSPPCRFATLCTCEEQALKAKTQEREWCENPDLKDAGSVIVSVTSFIFLLYSKGVLLCSLNPGQKFSSVLSPWCRLTFSSHSFFFFTVAYCQSKQPGAETCFTPEMV